MQESVNVFALSGSLRQGSYNSAALRACQSLAPAGMKIEIGSIADVPLYNADVQAQGFPDVVQGLAARIQAADALLFATPEYNYSVPGTLKNAIDWLSRLPQSPFAGKPAAIIGASMGPVGTGRAQYHLRQIGVYLDLRFLNRPEVLIGSAHERFDTEGRLTHEPTREFLGKFLLALRDWVAWHRR
ncbi:NADPH-dependent FMN reductase [Solimonas soli]|uniref:NADPH-dependent FMN reductase n=1 Tax=Solimonas soli TaxID=413479 RepID=UPI000485BBCC|nr:NAD(P)H-dependent oxidoreductase [Solimonas soli]